jgi:hypothetical protein
MNPMEGFRFYDHEELLMFVASVRDLDDQSPIPQAEEYDFIWVCANTPWINESIELNELEQKPVIEIAAYFHVLGATSALAFEIFAHTLSDYKLSTILIELLRYQPHTFLILINQLGENRIESVLKQMYLLDKDKFYPLLLATLLENDRFIDIGRWIVSHSGDEIRSRLALETVVNTRFTLLALQFFEDYDDLYRMFNELVRSPLRHLAGPLFISGCLEKLIPKWLEKLPFEQDDPEANIFYKITQKTFVHAINRIVQSPIYTEEMGSTLLHALDWNCLCPMGDKIHAENVYTIGALLSLAGSKEEVDEILEWVDFDRRVYSHHESFAQALSAGIVKDMNLFLAHLILHVPEEKALTVPIQGKLLNILFKISNVPDAFLSPMLEHCSPVLVNRILNEELPFLSFDENPLNPSVLRISTMQMLQQLSEDQDGSTFINKFFRDLPRFLLILAMQNRRGQELLAKCYKHLTDPVMHSIESYLPENMLEIPSMLPFVGNVRCQLLEKMDEEKYQMECGKVCKIAKKSHQKVKRARDKLEAELNEVEPNLETLKKRCTEYQELLNREGDIDPGMRQFLTGKREREEELDEAEISLWGILKEQHMSKVRLFMAGSPIARAQVLIHASNQEACLSEYIFNIIPKADHRRLKLMGIESDDDLKVIGLDLQTQEIVEAYRQSLAACIPEEGRSEALMKWREMSALEEKEMRQQAEWIVKKMEIEGTPPIPEKPQGISRLLPSRKRIKEGSWVDAVLWVVKASAAYIWKKYSSQDNLEEVWQKWEGLTLATCGKTKRAELLCLNQLQSKKQKVE